MGRRKDKNGFRVFDDPPARTEAEELLCDCTPWPDHPDPNCKDCRGTGKVRMSSLDQARANRRISFGDPFKIR